MNFNIVDFGAKESNVDNAIYIQKAIDKANKNNGIVTVPKGIYLTSTIFLKDNISLFLEEGATLKAVDDISSFDLSKRKVEKNLDVPTYENCDYDGTPKLFFIYGKHLHNVTISGKGKIDGNEEIFYGYQDRYFIDGSFYPRMPLLFLEDIEKLEIKDVTLTHSAFWTVHMVGCKNVYIHNLTIRNNLKLANCDGIDPDHCQYVRITNCDIECADDAIVFKNTKANRKYGDCHDIEVTDCKLKTTSGAIKFGTESFDDFYNINIKDITINDSNRGITLQLRDPGNIYDCSFKNITMSTRVFAKPYYWGYGEPICITALNRNENQKAGKIHNLAFKNIDIDSENGILIYGENSFSISDIYFKNIKMYLHRKSKWPKDKIDLRPYEKCPFIDGKVNELYIRNATDIYFSNLISKIDEDILIGSKRDIDNENNIEIK